MVKHTQALAIKCDIRSEEEIKAAVEKAVSHFGGIDICVNNASAIFPKGVCDHAVLRFVNAETFKTCVFGILQAHLRHP